MQIKCMRCQGKSERHDRMMDLTVEINGDVGSLEDALAHFTATEVLDGENKYHCTRFVPPVMCNACSLDFFNAAPYGMTCI